MLIFMDTSALVKRYIEEKGSSIIDDYYSSSNDISIAPITEIELNSALKRKLDDKSINISTYNAATIAWHFEKQFYRVIHFNDRMCECAIAILKSHRLRTLDAIQLASAMQIIPDAFVVSDSKLYKTAVHILPSDVTFI